MKTKRDYCERTFNDLLVTITSEGKIAIVGDWNSNFGLIYACNLERYKNAVANNTEAWLMPQIIGMDWDFGLTTRVSNWIHGKINSGKFDHLLKD